ncbi:MAG: pyrroline-5-carboxylate reductase [Xanthomonadales bacterium]|nr:pyrroline-5-carboxylate reductase [Xanthomonadales bacterium]
MTSSDPTPAPNIAFIGGGNMARSLVAGLRRRGHPGARIRVADPDAAARQALARDFDVTVGDDAVAVLPGADVVVMAVKPQVMAGVCTLVAPALPDPAPVFVSIAAGIRSDQVDAWLGGDRAVVRAMPNTPALLGEGATGLFANGRCTAAQRILAESVLSAVGSTAWIAEEALMDVVTAVSGSGPAYFFRLIEALEAAAIRHGLPAGVARALVVQTAQGAGRMAAGAEEDPATLRRRVTSPGGTTAAAMAELDAQEFDALIDAAVAAAVRRGGELAEVP